jgi:hypothetical protein
MRSSVYKLIKCDNVKDLSKQKWDVSSGVTSWHLFHIACNRYSVKAWLPCPFMTHRVSRHTDNVSTCSAASSITCETRYINCSSSWHWDVCVVHVCVCTCMCVCVVCGRACICGVCMRECCVCACASVCGVCTCARARVCVCMNVEWYGFWKYTCNYYSSNYVHVQMVCTGVHCPI